MTNYETFVPTIGYLAFILFILAVIGVGGGDGYLCGSMLGGVLPD